MRIISGKYRGRKLKEFELNTTKPTIDRVKEAIFNLIQFNVVDSVVLDLFSGTGALGIEAISRGAKKTYLIDNNDKAIQIIKENTKNMVEDFEIIKTDYIDFLYKNLKFDIVFLDPPYATDYGIDAINRIIKNDMLSKKGIIVFETSDDKCVNFDFSGYKIDRRKYGSVAVYIIRKENEDNY